LKVLIHIEGAGADHLDAVAAALAEIDGIEPVFGDLEQAGSADLVLVTPAPGGLSAGAREAVAQAAFSVEVQPDNTHAGGIDHDPGGTDAMLLGAGVAGYALAVRAAIERGRS